MKNISTLTLIMFFCIASQNAKFKTEILVTNASIVDVENGIVIPDQFISITNDTIRAVGPMADLEHYEAITLVDAKNTYVMPGLWDNHVHFRGGDSLIAENRNFLKMFLAFGVTTVRDCGGDITPSVMAWKDSIQNRLLDGPNIYTSGFKLDGPKPAWEGSFPIHDGQDITTAFDSLQSVSVDFVPLSTDIRKAMDLGLDGIEHMYYFLPVSSPVGDSLRNLNIGYRALRSLVATHDPALVKPFMIEAASKGLFVTPTMHIGKILEELPTKDHLTDTLLAYMGPGIIKTYEGRIASAKRRSPEAQKSFEQMERIFNAMVLPAYDSGVSLMAGSDCGAFNSYVYPGASLHGELEMLVADGLSPAQALQASFVNGPEFFDVGDSYGHVSPGKVADLILLEKNPLENIENTRRVHTVIQRSKIYNKKTLNDFMSSIKEVYAAKK